jgi:hypothetical protein
MRCAIKTRIIQGKNNNYTAERDNKNRFNFFAFVLKYVHEVCFIRVREQFGTHTNGKYVVNQNDTITCSAR